MLISQHNIKWNGFRCFPYASPHPPSFMCHGLLPALPHSSPGYSSSFLRAWIRHSLFSSTHPLSFCIEITDFLCAPY